MGVVEPKSKPTTWTCNACGHVGEPSKEHLIHTAIARVIFGDRSLTPSQVRERLRSDRFQEFGQYTSPNEEDRIGRVWLDQWIRGLICQTCNEGWAKDLEERAGDNLYDFIHLRGRADAALLRRWAWFFAIKLWFSHKRTEYLADGPGLQVLGKVARSDFSVAMPVRLVRLPFSPRNFDITGFSGWGGAPDSTFMMFVIGSVAFLVIGSEKPTFRLPIPNSTELTDGLRWQDVVMLRRGQVGRYSRLRRGHHPYGPRTRGDGVRRVHGQL